MLLGLLSFCGGHRLSVPLGVSTGKSRLVFLKLDRPAWFLERLHAAGLAHDLGSESSKERIAYALCGVVEVRLGTTYQCSLTRFSDEARLLHRYFRQPKDAIVCEVQRVAMARQEVRLRKGTSLHSPILASKTFFDFEPLRVILQGWGYEGMS